MWLSFFWVSCWGDSDSGHIKFCAVYARKLKWIRAFLACWAGLRCGFLVSGVLLSICCCFRFGAHNFLGAVCGCLCLAFALFVLLLLVVACAGVRHFFCFFCMVGF
jgi:hypothetical protein